jgi:hypothetical protein
MPAWWAGWIRVRVRARAQKTAAQGIVDVLKPDILKFHDMSKGNIESIGLLFSESEYADVSSTRTRVSFLSMLSLPTPSCQHSS